jgi:hypothetical protein
VISQIACKQYIQGHLEESRPHQTCCTAAAHPLCNVASALVLVLSLATLLAAALPLNELPEAEAASESLMSCACQ